MDGRRVELYARTKERAYQRLREALRARDEGSHVSVKSDTVERFLTDWLEAKRPSWKLSAYRFNEKYVRNHLVPELGSVQLAKLSAAQLQKLYARKLERLSPTSVRHMHAVLHSALSSAVRWNVLTRNPADSVVPPRATTHDITPLDSAQVRSLLSALEGDRLKALYVLALTTGMRQGELLALTWRGVNTKAGFLEVTGTLQPDGKIAEPKTKSSLRRKRLSDAALLALQRLSRDSVRVFPYSPIRISRHYRGLAQRLGFPSTRFHDLRHTCATLLLGEGVHPKIVSEMLGHSRIQTTLDLYSHVTPAMQEQVARTMDRLLHGDVA